MKNDNLNFDKEMKKLEMLDKARKMLEQIAAQQNVPAVKEETAPAAITGATPSKEVAGRIDINKHIRPGEPEEILDIALYTAALATVPDEKEEVPVLPTFYYGRGGRLFKKKLLDPKTRRQAFDEILMRQLGDLELCAQGCMAYLSSLKGIQLVTELKDNGSPFHSVLALLMKINSEQRSVMCVDSKLRGVQAHQLNIGKADKVIFAANDGSVDDKQSSQGNPLIEGSGISEDDNVP